MIAWRADDVLDATVAKKEVNVSPSLILCIPFQWNDGTNKEASNKEYDDLDPEMDTLLIEASQLVESEMKAWTEKLQGA